MALNTYTVGAAGTGVRTYAAVTNGDAVTVDSAITTFLHIRNGNGSACVVTIADPGLTPAGNAAVARTVSVPATTGDEMILLPFAAANASQQVSVTYSVTATVTGAFIRA